MNSTQVRDSRNKFVGSFVTRHDGVVEARDANYHLMGTYDPLRNVTCDSMGNRVGSGNMLAKFFRI